MFSFTLPDEFVSEYAGRRPDWGFPDAAGNALGEITFIRSYSRVKPDGTKERWHEVCRRVIEGMFSIQKDHCLENRLPWSDTQALNAAKEAYERMFTFKWLPPGRGIWMMGTEYVNGSRKNSAALQNCLAGETEVVTEKGIFPIGELSGSVHRLLTTNGRWVDAPVSSFGVQPLMRLSLRRGKASKEVYATPGHRWFAKHGWEAGSGLIAGSPGFATVTTEDLEPGMYLRSSFGQGPNTEPSPFGIAHGVTFGDGRTSMGDRFANSLTLCGEKNRQLLDWFPNSRTRITHRDDVEVLDLPNSFRELPDIGENTSYLLGWLMGYFAADGSVSPSGQAGISSTCRENLEFVRSLCAKIGLGCGPVTVTDRISNLTGRPSRLYKVSLFRSTIPSGFFLIDEHARKFEAVPVSRKGRAWRVVSVEATDRVEEVFCATVEGTEAFTLADNILTGNCSFTSTADIDADDPAEPFAFLMEASMLGIGVGFDTLGGYRGLVIHAPDVKRTRTFVVPDSREGWVRSVSLILNSYLKPSQPAWRFDYSEVRPAGAPIRGFGGTASGPDPLIRLHEAIDRLFEGRAGSQLTTIDIVDIANLIGVCVVAGNVRRCLPAGTRVHTERGSIPIEQVVAGDVVVTSAGRAPVRALFDQGVQETVRIRHEFGTFECTPNHKVAVFDTLTSWKFKRADELVDGDHLVWDPTVVPGSDDMELPSHTSAGTVTVAAGFRRGNGRAAGFHRSGRTCSVAGCVDLVTASGMCNRHYLRDRKHGDPLKVASRAKPITVPALDVETAWLVGLVQGDGYTYERADGKVGHVSVVFDPRYPAVVDAARQAFARFGIDRLNEVPPTTADGSMRLRASSVELARWVFGNVKQPRTPLQVPEWVFRATPDVRAAYLAGLFDADGSALTRPLVLVSTVYEGFAYDVVKVAASLGVALEVKRARENHPGGWQDLFHVNVVGFESNGRVRSWLEAYSKKYSAVPFHQRSVRFGFSKEFGAANGLPAGYGGAGVRRFTVAATERLSGLKLDAYPVRFLGLEPGRSVATFDIEVDGIHQFTAEGLVVHNSAEIALGLPSDRDFVDAKNPERFPERNSYDPSSPGWGWMSNNSLSVKVGDDYAPFVDNIVLNGEPGFVWNDLARAYGRLADGPNNADWRVMGTNPCVTADTWVMTGQGARQVSELVGTGFDVLVDGVPHRSSGFFSTGVKPVFDLTTDAGHKLTLTADHKVMTPSGWRPAGELEAGDQVTLSDHAGADWSGPGTADEGYVLGHLVGDGTFTSDGRAVLSVREDGEVADRLARSVAALPHGPSFGGWSRSGPQRRLSTKALTGLAAEYGIVRGSETITGQVERASREFTAGFLRGLFDADGHVEGSSTGSGVSVRLSQSDRGLLEAAQRMLLRLGIRSSIRSGRPEQREGRAGSMPEGVYRAKEQLRLIVSGEHTERFMEAVGFEDAAKRSRWEEASAGMSRGFYDKPHVATVVSVTPAGEREVFDVQVPGVNAFCANGIFVHNCGEMNLESFEMCTLVEAFLHRHDSLDDFLRTLKFAYLYAKTVTLVATHWPKTNAVMQRNRRIGCSISGIASFLDARGEGELVAWMEAGYGEIGHWDRVYSEWLCVRESIKRSTVKPSGSVSIVAGSTPGVHWSPGGEFFLRTIRFGAHDPMVPLFVNAGYLVEDDLVSAGTKVVYFPIHAEVSRSEKDVTIGEKIALAALAQRHWSDNSVSVTVSFDAEKEAGRVGEVLKVHDGQLKSVSFLPMGNRVYPQQPYTQISREEYEAYVGVLQPVSFDPVYDGTSGNVEAEGEAYCSTDVCEIPSLRTPGAAEFEDADADAGREPASRPASS